MIPPAVANHASFLELLPDGELLLAWFAGTAEGANNCSIVLASLPPKSTQWSEASLISRREGYSNQNPVLFLDPTGQVRKGGRKRGKKMEVGSQLVCTLPLSVPHSLLQVVYLFHSQQPASSNLSSAEADANIWMLQSFDRGLNWTKPQDLFTKKGSFDRNRIIYSLSGDWIFPIYYAGNFNVSINYLHPSFLPPSPLQWMVMRTSSLLCRSAQTRRHGRSTTCPSQTIWCSLQ